MYLEKNPSINYNIGDLLAVTIAPDDQHQFVNKPDRYQSYAEYMFAKCCRIFADTEQFDFWMKTEISEPIGQTIKTYPRLHNHGMVRLKTKKAVRTWLGIIMPDLLDHAILSIKTIKTQAQYDGWVKYCNKQNSIMGSAAMSNLTDITYLTKGHSWPALKDSELEDSGEEFDSKDL